MTVFEVSTSTPSGCFFMYSIEVERGTGHPITTPSESVGNSTAGDKLSTLYINETHYAHRQPDRRTTSTHGRTCG